MGIESLITKARTNRRLDPAIGRRLREAVGLSQRDLAEPLGVTQSALSKWESGTRKPRGSVRQAYADLLDRLAREVTQ